MFGNVSKHIRYDLSVGTLLALGLVPWLGYRGALMAFLAHGTASAIVDYVTHAEINTAKENAARRGELPG